MTTQSQQQMAHPHQGQATAGGSIASQPGAGRLDVSQSEAIQGNEGFCGAACGAGAGAAVIWQPITVETRRR